MHDDLAYARAKAAQTYDQYFKLNAPSSVIIDFGCGTGLVMSYLCDLFDRAQIIGVEPNDEDFRLAKEFHEKMHFFHSPLHLESIDVSKSCANLIVMADVLHHYAVQDQQQIIKNVFQILKPRGSLIIFEPSPWNIKSRFSFDCRQSSMISPYRMYRLLKPFGAVKITNSFDSFFTAQIDAP